MAEKSKKESRAKSRPKKTGRPSTYKAKYAVEILEYFDREPFTINHMGEQVANEFPTLAGYARSIGVWSQRLWEWGKLHPEFRDAIKRCKDIQEDMLVANGMMGRYEKSFAIFASKNIIGWRDKQEVKQDTSISIDISAEDAKL